MQPPVGGEPHRGEDAGGSVEAVRAHLETVLASRAFAGAWRQQRLLRFLIEKFAQGCAAELKEYCLGVEVFDKGEDFDPRLDPIVRVEASRLRARLKKYYESEGQHEPIRFELPRGGYVPRIVERPPLVDCAATEGADKGPARLLTGPARARWIPAAALWLVFSAAVVLFGWLGAREFLAGGTGKGKAAAYAFARITREQVRCSFPSLSPDGKFLLYAHREPAHWDLYVRRLDSHQMWNVTAGSPADDYHPAYSPDGTRIAFRSDRDGGGIFVTQAAGGPAVRLSKFGYHPAWSPDGRHIVFSSGTFVEPEDGPARRASTLYVVEVESRSLRALTSPETVLDAVQPAWSPHGHRIAFWGSGPDGRRDLWTIPATGSLAADVRALPVTQDDWIDWSPAWSPDGKHLYFSSDRDGTMGIWRVRIEEKSGTVRGLPESVRTPSSYSTHPAPSGGGEGFAYTHRTISSTLHVVPFRPDGEASVAAARQLTPESRQVREPEISPKGEWLTARIQDPQEDLVLMRPDGTGLRRLTDDRFKDRNARWSPDGSYVLFLSNRGGPFEYWAIRPDGSGLRRVAPAVSLIWQPRGELVGYPGDGKPYCVEPAAGPCPVIPLPEAFLPMAWSPDGTRVAGRIRSLPPPREELFVYSLQERSFWKVSDHGWSPVWLKDGRLLFQEAGKIWLWDARDRRRRAVLSPARGVLQQRFALSADQRSLFFVLTHVEEEIWIARRP